MKKKGWYEAWIFESYKPVQFVVRGNSLDVMIFKSRNTLERTIAFSLLFLLFAASFDNIFVYVLYLILLLSSVLFLCSNTRLILNNLDNTITRETYLRKKRIFVNYNFTLHHALVIKCESYNPLFEERAFNSDRHNFFIEYVRKFILLSTDDEEIVNEFRNFFNSNSSFLFQGELIQFQDLGYSKEFEI